MKTYKIADLLTPEQKRLALNAKMYTPLDPTERCPLGWAFQTVDANPQCGEIVKLIAGVKERALPMPQPGYTAIVNSVNTFMDDWDRGRIPVEQLPIALGVEV